MKDSFGLAGALFMVAIVVAVIAIGWYVGANVGKRVAG